MVAYVEYHASSEGSCRRGARRAAEWSSPGSPAPDGRSWEPGASRARFRIPSGHPSRSGPYAEGSALAIPDPIGSRPVHLAALSAIARTANDGLLVATALV